MTLTWNLEVLTRAIQYKNLSAAAAHVGLSQPQLSRIVKKLEDDLEMQLLDRSVKRQSSWTPQARKLAEIQVAHQRRLESSIKNLQQGGRTHILHIGTLEGMAEVALQMTHSLFGLSYIQQIHLDVLDRNDLDARFLAGSFEIILTSEVPSKAKFKNVRTLGYQSLVNEDYPGAFSIRSAFEHSRLGRKGDQPHDGRQLLVSNSLLIRQGWLKKWGGQGRIPSAVDSQNGRGKSEVLVVAHEILESEIWNRIGRFKIKSP